MAKHMRNKGKFCNIAGCMDNAICKGFCRHHYDVLRKRFVSKNVQKVNITKVHKAIARFQKDLGKIR